MNQHIILRIKNSTAEKKKEGTTESDMRGIFLSMKMEWHNQVEMRMDIYTYIHIHKHHQNVK